MLPPLSIIEMFNVYYEKFSYHPFLLEGGGGGVNHEISQKKVVYLKITL